jgi:hypothetical protein
LLDKTARTGRSIKAERFERSGAIERLERFEQNFGYLPSSMLTTMMALAMSQPSVRPRKISFPCFRNSGNVEVRLIKIVTSFGFEFHIDI